MAQPFFSTVTIFPLNSLTDFLNVLLDPDTHFPWRQMYIYIRAVRVLSEINNFIR